MNNELIKVTILKIGNDFFVTNSIDNINYGPFDNIRSATMYAAGFKSALHLTYKRVIIEKEI